MHFTKKIITYTLIFFILIAFSTSNTNALSISTTQTCEKLAENLYCVTTITEYSSPNNTSLFSTSSKKTASKTSEYTTSSGVPLWYVTVTASFTYNGSSARCTSASVSADSYNSSWKVSNRNSTYSGNTGTASATGKKYSNSQVIKTINKSVSLSCTKNGALY